MQSNNENTVKFIYAELYKTAVEFASTRNDLADAIKINNPEVDKLYCCVLMVYRERFNILYHIIDGLGLDTGEEVDIGEVTLTKSFLTELHDIVNELNQLTEEKLWNIARQARINNSPIGRRFRQNHFSEKDYSEKEVSDVIDVISTILIGGVSVC